MEGLINAFRSLGAGRILALFIGIAALIAIAGFTVSRMSQPGMALLYGGLTAAEASKITDMLTAQNVAYQVKGDGAVYVPENQVGTLRLQAAGQGLVGGSGSGYELFDNQSTFGTTNFVQNLNAKRALEGELARTISTLPAVQGARVHLVLPRQSLFSHEETPPSAAVALNLGSRTLDSGQVQSIAQLVAAAVPNLTTHNVTVIDQRGTLLFNGADADLGANTANKARRDVEKSYEDTLTPLLERVVGAGKAVVRVTADINLDRIQENAELYDPTQQVVRSEQTVETNNKSADGSGSNPPPVGVQGNTPGNQPGGAAGGAGTQSTDAHTETTTNYEIGKTVRQTNKDGGDVKKLSVAVLVEGKNVTNDKGESTYTPMPDDEKAKLRSLVESAIGYNADRGDKIEVVDMPFNTPAEPEAVSAPMMSHDQLFQLGETGLLVLALLAVAFVVVRPALTLLAKAAGSPSALPALQAIGPMGSVASAPNQLVAGTNDSLIDMSRVEGRVRESSVKKVNEIVDQHPEESLAVIRGWMSGSPSSPDSA